MEQIADKRVQKTRERLREAAHRLFLSQGYSASSIEAILKEAGISSKETFYRHYANKEALFVDVLSNLTMEQPGFVERLATLPAPSDLPSLHQALAQFSHEIVAMMLQPGYLPLVRMVLTESSRFPQLSLLFFSTVTQRGIDLLMAFLQSAREYQAIANLDLEAVTRTLLGGLIGTVLMSVVIQGELNQSVILARVDANTAVFMRALTPST